MNVSPEIKTLVTVSVSKEDFQWLFDNLDFPKNEKLVIVNIQQGILAIKELLTRVKIPDDILQVIQIAYKSNIGFVQFGVQPEYIQFDGETIIS